jgi:hypothetical protein
MPHSQYRDPTYNTVQARFFRRAIKKACEDMRWPLSYRLIHCVYWDGLTIPEAALVLGISIRSASARHCSILNALANDKNIQGWR